MDTEIGKAMGATEEIQALMTWMDSNHVNETSLRDFLQKRIAVNQGTLQELSKQHEENWQKLTQV